MKDEIEVLTDMEKPAILELYLYLQGQLQEWINKNVGIPYTGEAQPDQSFIQDH